MLKNVTITLPEDVALWARKKAAEENTSVSRLVGKMLEEKIKATDEYWAAYHHLMALPPFDIDGDNRLSREEAHERR